MKARTNDSYTLPARITLAEKRDYQRRIKALRREIERGMRGPWAPIDPEKFLKEARRRFPEFAR